MRDHTMWPRHTDHRHRPQPSLRARISLAVVKAIACGVVIGLLGVVVAVVVMLTIS